MKGIVIMFALLLPAALAAQTADFRAETNRYYSGVMDGKYAFNMVLSMEGDACMGSYYYLKYKNPIFVYGKCSDSAFDLQEQPRQLGYTAGVGFKMPGHHNIMTGEIVGNGLSGYWHARGKEKSFPFFAKEVEPDKKAILENAVGTYELSGVSAFCCANSMADYIKDGGSWSTAESAISNGRRESSDSSISKKEERLLSSFTLVLDESLEIRLYSAGQLIATLPYTSGSGFYVTDITQQEDKKNNIGRIFKYKDVDTFIGNVVHMATTDKFKLLPYVPAPLQDESSRHAISVDYDPVAMEFQIAIISEQCCDNATLYLRKK